MKLAIFDFDGTLYPFETFPYIYRQWKVQGKSMVRYNHGFVRFMPLYLLYRVGIAGAESMRKRAVFAMGSMFNGMTEGEIEVFFDRAYEGMKSRIDPVMLKEISRCKQDGYTLVLLSGALKPILDRTADEHGFSYVLGTALPIKEGRGSFPKEFDYIQGNFKAETLKKTFCKNNVDWEKCRAYADSVSDLAILELVGEPFAVRPEAKLAEIAQKRNWQILGNIKKK